MFEQFPYANFHELNMDWIVKIAKDFLDQYTHIQDVITTGEKRLNQTTATGITELQDKATNLENLLQQWYDTHSADIANALIAATADFNQAAEQKAAETIRTIPSDYTALSNSVLDVTDHYLSLGNTNATSLTAESDVNNLAVGNYVVPTFTIAQALQLPVTSGCKLYVFQGNAIGRYAQVCIGSDDLGTAVGVRWNNGSTWSAWSRLATTDITDEITSNLNGYAELTNIAATYLTDTDSVDSLTSGNYVVPNSAVASAVDLPYASGGRLFVIDGHAMNRKIEVFLSDGSVYIRSQESATSWTAWSNYSQLSEVVKATNITVASTADLDDFNNAPINSIITVNRVDIPNAPPGDGFLINPDSTTGILRGMLVTFSPRKTMPFNQIFQIYIGYYASITDNYPDLCYRFALTSGGSVTWSPWGKFSQDKFLGASNIVLRASTAQQFFTNLNNAPINSIYQIDKDCVAGVLTNHPAPGYSAVLMTYAFAVSTRHGIVQTLYSLQNGDVVEYIRYGWLNNVDDYRFSPWRKTVTEAVT